MDKIRFGGSPKFDKLVKELGKIGETDGFISSKPGGKFDNDCHHIRAREIGKILNANGGKNMMLAVHQLVFGGRSLEHCWNRIGEWYS